MGHFRYLTFKASRVIAFFEAPDATMPDAFIGRAAETDEIQEALNAGYRWTQTVRGSAVFEAEAEADDPRDLREKERLKKLLDRSIDYLNLSMRAAKCLQEANIKTVRELSQQTAPALLRYRNFGRRSLTDVVDKLQQLGLSLAIFGEGPP